MALVIHQHGKSKRTVKLARKRTQVHVVHMHSEEDGEGGKEEPKVHCRL